MRGALLRQHLRPAELPRPLHLQPGVPQGAAEFPAGLLHRPRGPGDRQLSGRRCPSARRGNLPGALRIALRQHRLLQGVGRRPERLLQNADYHPGPLQYRVRGSDQGVNQPGGGVIGLRRPRGLEAENPDARPASSRRRTEGAVAVELRRDRWPAEQDPDELQTTGTTGPESGPVVPRGWATGAGKAQYADDGAIRRAARGWMKPQLRRQLSSGRRSRPASSSRRCSTARVGSTGARAW